MVGGSPEDSTPSGTEDLSEFANAWYRPRYTQKNFSNGIKPKGLEVTWTGVLGSARHGIEEMNRDVSHPQGHYLSLASHGHVAPR